MQEVRSHLGDRQAVGMNTGALQLLKEGPYPWRMIYEPNQCPIRFGLGVFGDRWSLLVVRDMMFCGRTRFQDFLDAGEGISSNILSDRLSRLESQQIIS